MPAFWRCGMSFHLSYNRHQLRSVPWYLKDFCLLLSDTKKLKGAAWSYLLLASKCLSIGSPCCRMDIITAPIKPSICTCFFSVASCIWYTGIFCFSGTLAWCCNQVWDHRNIPLPWCNTLSVAVVHKHCCCFIMHCSLKHRSLGKLCLVWHAAGIVCSLSLKTNRSWSLSKIRREAEL